MGRTPCKSDQNPHHKDLHSASLQDGSSKDLAEQLRTCWGQNGLQGKDCSAISRCSLPWSKRVDEGSIIHILSG